MTIADVPGFESEYSGTKSRYIENLAAPWHAEPVGILLKLRWNYVIMRLEACRSVSVKSRRAGMGNPG
ncbi:MAG: hypothetical protein CEE38_05995 [Planctomycetes bacterium B3_Pla]|nr:MAG: hypothetical protein CEE38_05995 [Planctomycetes bacterium B3_Pla]